MLYRIVVVFALAAMFCGCGKNLTGPTEVVKSEAQMEGGNLEVSLPLPEWLKAKLSALPAGKLVGGDTGPVAIYITVSRTAAGGVETQSFPLVPDLTAGVARGAVKIDLGQITVQAFYRENGLVLFRSKEVPFTVAPNKKYLITFQMERVDAANVSFAATWDTTKVEQVVITDTTTVPVPEVPTPGPVPVPEVPTPVPTPGDITVGLAEDSPDGNVIDGAISVPLAKFSFTARGEDILVSGFVIITGIVDANADPGKYSLSLENTRILFDGSQIGATGATQSEIVSSYMATTFSFGHNFLVKNGQTRVVTVVADLTSPQLEHDDAITTTLVPGDNALGLSSSARLWVPHQAITARTLTVKSGVIAVAKNTAFADRSAAMPTGVASATNVQIASFSIKAGYEEVNIVQIVLKDPVNSNQFTNQLGRNFQDLRLMHDGAQIGETIGALDNSGTAATYSFSLVIRLNALEKYVVDVYAGILSSPQYVGVVLNPVIVVDAVGAAGVATDNNDGLNPGQFIYLQNAYISMGGSLTIITSVDTPPSQLLMMGETDKEVFNFKLSASVDEDILVSDILVGAVTDPFYPGGTFRNAKLYQGSTQIGTTSNWVKWPAPMSTNYYMVAGFWNLSLRVPRNSSVTLTLKVDVTSNTEGAASGFSAVFYLLPDYDGLASGDQPSIVARGASSAMLLTGDALRFSPDKYSVYSAPITVYATKISVAWASDTPRGEAVPTAAQIVAKVVISNAANVGNYSAVVRSMNFDISTSHKKFATKQSYLKIFKDSVAESNLVGITSWPAGAAIGGNTSIMNTRDTVNDSMVGFNDVEITPGESKVFVVTMDTDSMGLSPYDILAITIPSDGIVWRDGVGNNDITAAVEGLPSLSTKAFTY